jgi:hypothetical protein
VDDDMIEMAIAIKIQRKQVRMTMSDEWAAISTFARQLRTVDSFAATGAGNQCSV